MLMRKTPKMKTLRAVSVVDTQPIAALAVLNPFATSTLKSETERL